jgi:hypothetical protein
VSLSDGATAVVTEQTNESLYPRVVVLTGREGEPLRPPRLLDLSHDKRISIQGCNPPTTQFDLQKAIFEAA